MRTHPLVGAIEELRAGLSEWWDADDGMSDDYVMALPPGRFVMTAYAHDPAILRWLVYFVARRALSCWELSCDDGRPRRLVEELGDFLREGVPVDWVGACRATPSPFSDCRYSDTQGASDAVAEAARYIHTGDPLRAIYCLSAGDCAYGHVLTEDSYREWLVEVAIPVALEKREMTPSEQEAMRGRGPG